MSSQPEPSTLDALRAHAAALTDAELREQVVYLNLQLKILVDALVRINTPKPTGPDVLSAAREFAVKTASGQATLRGLAKVNGLEDLAALLDSVR